MSQITDTILMVRPVQFRLNEETAVNNYYQDQDFHQEIKDATANSRAQDEFDAFAKALQVKGINVIIVSDDDKHDTPDSIFPNNWLSTHANGDAVLYPMFAENRRLERRPEVLDRLEEEGFQINNIVDYTSAEDEDVFLEGTGSLLLDRVNEKAYCSISPRADEDLLIEFCEDFEYTPVIFTAYQTVDNKRLPIYHTNVMMALGEEFAVICLDCIDEKKQRKNVLKHLKADGKHVVAITEDQVNAFAGNMIQVKNATGKKFLVMSDQAYNSLDQNQIKQLEKFNEIIHPDIKTIETLGGGSVRCMMAEVFLPRR
ncbi:citrulline utilization hydrolase CtlX [Nonlabens ponticola]|uniref:Amidinotransferase n=1 Tax=Nonlabens ponticola TaxID=2496866 RepID=A0A3S9N0P9_9FLAO|nr:arginine deiminase-related protein [Nonlabens ponticola]AZQ44968.1 amidinotransferase [Nonlabens ponticola]